MKKITLLTLLLLGSTITFSQALVFEGSQWHYSFGAEFSFYSTLTYSGDTLIGDSIVNILHTETLHPNGNFINEFDDYLLSTNDRVYRYVDDEFQLLYDLNMNVGDTLPTLFRTELLTGQFCNDTGFSIIDSVGIRNINGVDLRYLYLREQLYWENIVTYHGYIYERIGPTGIIGEEFNTPPSGYLFPANYHCTIGLDAPYFTKFRCYNDAEFTFQNPYFNQPCDFVDGIVEYNLLQQNIFPNPSNGEFRIPLPENTEVEIKVFNLLGDMVYWERKIKRDEYLLDITSQENGLYLINVLTKNGDSYFSKIIKE